MVHLIKNKVPTNIAAILHSIALPGFLSVIASAHPQMAPAPPSTFKTNFDAWI
jgi:hypothetical protein